MMLHNEENVMDIMPVGIGEVWPTAEKNRLVGIYGHKVVETCFPGRNFRMDYMMTEDTDLPFYVDGVLAAGPPKPPGEDPKPPGEDPKPAPIPMPAPKPESEPDEDEEGETGDEHAKTATPPLDPIFKRGRAGRPPHVGT
jgi:hypothetical protein